MSTSVKRVIGGVVAGILLAAALALVGLELPFALAWGVLVVAVVASRQLIPTDNTQDWPPAPTEPRVRRSEVARLAWTFDSSNGSVPVRRVRQLVERRLARRGLSIDNPADASAIDNLIGPDVRAMLNRSELRPEELDRVFAAADTLSPTEEGS